MGKTRSSLRLYEGWQLSDERVWFSVGMVVAHIKHV